MKKNNEAKKIKNQLINRFYEGNRMRWWLAMVSTLAASAGVLVISWLLQAVVDAAAGVEGTLPLNTLVLIALALYGAMAVLYFILYHTKPVFVSRAMRQYRDHVLENISRKGITAFSAEGSSLYTSALSNDTAIIEKSYINSTFDIATHILTFVGAFAMMLWYSPLLTLVTVGFTALPVVASLITGNRIAKAEKTLSDRNEGYLGYLRDCLTGFSVIKSFKAEKPVLELMAEASAKVAAAKCRRDKISIIVSTIGMAAGTLTQLGVFFVSAYLALAGKGITPGVIILFVQLINFVISPISELPVLLSERKAAKALIEKMAEALALNVRQEGKGEAASLGEAIELENVTFGYEEGKTILNGLSARFEAGKCYAVVGGSGSGKSTLLNLLAASRDSYSGAIRFDGDELRSLSSDSLYDLISMVQQNVFVFNASIRDNITMFSDFPEEEVSRAIELAGLSSLIAQKGEDYLCGENGSGLSGGEKQRVSIARSLLKKCSLLLADEATASLDAHTAAQVTESILGLEGMTRVMVTHDLDRELLSRCDGILALKGGRIAEEGTFEELMERKGYFYSLYTVSQ